MRKSYEEPEEPEKKEDPEMARITRMVTIGLVVFVLAIVIFGTIVIIGPGERGVLVTLGKVEPTVFGEGMHFKTPIIQGVTVLNVQTQKHEADASSASQDLQTVQTKVALNYHLNPDTVNVLYQTIGIDYKSRVIDPAIQESVKASTAQFTAEELITKRAEVKDTIGASLRERLAPLNIIVDGISITDFDFSPEFNSAIEAKVTAEQNALAAKNKLEQIKYEAEQRVTQAQGEATAIEIQARAITSQGGAAYVQLQAIQKWNGALPQYMMGNSILFINIPATTQPTTSSYYIDVGDETAMPQD